LFVLADISSAKAGTAPAVKIRNALQQSLPARINLSGEIVKMIEKEDEIHLHICKMDRIGMTW
jgi:hypothetical protein